MKAGDIYRESEQILRPFTNSREVSSIEAYCLVSHVLNHICSLIRKRKFRRIR